MNKFSFLAPAATSMVGINVNTTLRSSHFALPFSLWKQQKYNAELKLMLLDIVKMKESCSGGCGKLTQRMETPKRLAQTKQELNPKPIVHWPVS